MSIEVGVNMEFIRSQDKGFAEGVERAARLGVGETTRSPLCTSCNRDEFFTHRGSSGRDGRMLAYLGRPLDGASLGA